MSRSMFSSSWYRVAHLKPQLRSHVVVHRQLFRGRPWYVLQDHAGGHFHRYSAEANVLIGQMDGERTLEQIWERAGEELGDELPTQDEVIQLLAQLHGADLVRAGNAPDVYELAERSGAHQRKAVLGALKSPLAIRLPLLDPDRFLRATLPFVRPAFTRIGFVLWLALVLAALVLAGVHWSELTENVVDRVLTAQNAVLLVATYVVVKAVHELGHGYAARTWGGEVHEVGLMFLVFVPVPYVDASASSAFESKWRRATVAAAGIMVEMTLAALALFVWLAVEPGLVRAAAFNVMLISGVSTVLFNGNPLLRFDGYYVLADVVEVPNLATRSNKYVYYLVQKHLFGVKDAVSPATLPSERGWLLGYGIAATTYRLFITSAIVLLVATKFFFIGIILAIWALISMAGVPIVKAVRFIFTSPALTRTRRRALSISGGALAALAIGLFIVPVSYGTVVKGVVRAPDDALINAGVDGFIAAVPAQPSSLVGVGDALVELEDPTLRARLRTAEAEVRELELRLAAVEFADPVQASVLREGIDHARANRDRLADQVAQLEVRSPGVGRFLMSRAADQTGRFVRKGELLGYVVSPDAPTVRVLVRQADIDPVRSRDRGAAVRFAGRLTETIPASVLRVEPAATDTRLHPALTTLGGGDVSVDPRDPQTTLERVFVVDLALPASDEAPPIGGRVFVRFDHGRAPIGYQAYRRLRQLFLRQFNV